MSSPAVDYLASLGQTADQRGFPRGVTQLGGIGRSGSNRFDLGAYEFDPHAQTETTIVAASHGATQKSYADANFSNGLGIQLPATNVGQYVTLVFISPRDGCYHVWARAKKGNNEGKFQLQYSPDLSGTKTQYKPWGAAQDLYAAKTGYVTYDLGYMNVNLVIGTAFYFQFLVTGKNAKSTGYSLYLDYVDVVYEDSATCNN